MTDQGKFGAQVVLKREDGRSILDTQGQTQGTAGAMDVSPERAEAARHALEKHGFKVTEGNLNTLSVSGAPETFEDVFGLHVRAPETNVGAHATRMPDDLRGYVADVFVMPPPEFFP
jgi:hypothetical protein